MAYPTTNDLPIIMPVVQDKYPLHFGSGATVAIVTSCLRLSEQGYRLHFCDLLRELIEGDPHAFGCCNTYCNAISGRPWSVSPAKTQSESEDAKAAFIADFVERAIHGIPRWRQHMNGLVWGTFYAVACREIMWRKGPRGEFLIDRLEFVHTRRLAYNWDWQLVWTVYGQTNEGTPLNDTPFKFIVYEPQTSDEYPSREGLGRTLAYWLAFKRFAVRDSLAYVERFGKPVPDVSWRKGDTNQPASDEDIAIAKDIAKRVGTGSMAGLAHPDTVEFAVVGNGANNSGSGGSGESTPHKALIAMVDEQVSKLVLGQAYTTNSGQHAGLGNSGDPFESTSQLRYVTGAAQLETVVDECVIRPLVELNFGAEAAAKYLPHYNIEIEDPEDEARVMDRIDKAVRLGYPMPVEYVSDRFDWPVPEEGDEVLSIGVNSKAYSVPEVGDDEPQEDETKLTPAKGEEDLPPEKGEE